MIAVLRKYRSLNMCYIQNSQDDTYNHQRWSRQFGQKEWYQSKNRPKKMVSWLPGWDDGGGGQ
jgi:hypothetical protein